MSENQKSVFDELPPVEAVVTMTTEEKAATLAKLEIALTEQGIAYQSANTAADLAQERLSDERKAWEAEHQDIITRAADTAQRANELKAQLQRGAVLRQALTGEKTWRAFQVAENWTMDYNADAMLRWLLSEAPGSWRAEFLKINVTDLNKRLISRLDEYGVPRPPEGAAPIPATGRKSYTGKVLSKELALLVAPPKPEPPPVAYIATLTSPDVSPIGETGWWHDGAKTFQGTLTIADARDNEFEGPYETEDAAKTALGLVDTIPF